MAQEGRGWPCRGVYATPVEGEIAYTVEEAAAILGETPELVMDKVLTGELHGIHPSATPSRQWKVLLPATLRSGGVLSVGEATDTPVEDRDGDREDARPAGGGPEDFVVPPQGTADTQAETPATQEPSRVDDAAALPESTAHSGWVSTQQAAKALGISPRTVRWHIEQGNLEAKPEGEGVKRHWLVSIDSLQAFRDSRRSAGSMPRDNRAPAEDVVVAAEGSGEAIRVLAERLEDAAARAAEYRVRLELSERTQSTLEADLAEERRRREAAERVRDELRRRLEAPREKPQEARESPASRGPRDDTLTAAPPLGPREPRGVTQSAADALRVPDPRPPSAGPRPSPRRLSLAGKVRAQLWRRVFGR
jgi:hypothetical protein